MAKKCEAACKEFEAHRSPAMIHQWNMMKHRWEVDPSQPDPYRVVEKGILTVFTTLQFLTLLDHRSLKLQFCKTKTCGDGSA